MDDVNAAQILISLLDLTSLNDGDTDSDIIKLCQKALTPYGNVAAVCIKPQFVPLAKSCLEGTGIKVATVANFPAGNTDFAKLDTELQNIVKHGADEIDIVFPYHSFINGDTQSCNQFFSTIKNALSGRKLPIKIIIESGELKTAPRIAAVSRMCIAEGMSFIKTSTGKTKVSATPEAANAILETIASGKRNIGFKASGGIKNIEEAKKYLILANQIMGFKWITPKNMRIGASSLLDNLCKTIERGY